MRLSSNQKRGLLRSAWITARAASSNLRDKLEELSVASSATFSGGRTVASTSGNGQSIAFSTPGADSVSPTDTTEAYEQLIALYDQVVSDTASLAENDEGIFAEMIGRLSSARTSRNSFLTVRSLP